MRDSDQTINPPEDASPQERLDEAVEQATKTDEVIPEAPVSDEGDNSKGGEEVVSPGEIEAAPLPADGEEAEPAQPSQPDAEEPPPSEEEEDFKTMFERSMEKLEIGEVVKGTIIATHSDFVVVDIGYKSEGQIPIDEFRDGEGKVNVQTGDKVEVLFEDSEDEDGLVVLSKEKADQLKIWEEISRVYKDDGVIEGKIVQKIKGGLSVDIGVPAFLPGSQVDLRPIRNLERMVGERFHFKILKFNKKRGNVVLSRRVLLETEREELRKKTLDVLEDGIIMEGIVKNVTNYGAFIDLGGIDGLLHITDMSWGRVSDPKDILNVGDRIHVKVLKYDRERERVSLGLKQTKPDPWSLVEDKYPIGTVVQGRIVSLTDYGAFVELEEGVEGLIHISEMSWTKKIKHPSQVVKLNDEVTAMVLNVDMSNQRISLGLKQTAPNPWEVVKEKYPVGKLVSGKIRNITDFGIFIGIEEGIDGLVHISDLSWKQRIKHPSELYKKGQEVEAMVLNVDVENERFSLGIKQLENDPWAEIPAKYKPGDHVTGSVTNVTDFGLFIEFETGIEGLVHISEISQDKVDDIHRFAKIGDQMTTEIISIDREERRIGLSIRAFEKSAEKAEMDAFLARQEGDGTTLGDILKEKDLVTSMGADIEEEPDKEVDAEAAPVEAADEEAPPEEPEEGDAEEAAADETPVEEAAAEEAPVEEAPVEEVAAEEEKLEEVEVEAETPSDAESQAPDVEEEAGDESGKE